MKKACLSVEAVIFFKNMKKIWLGKVFKMSSNFSGYKGMCRGNIYNNSLWLCGLFCNHRFTNQCKTCVDTWRKPNYYISMTYCVSILILLGKCRLHQRLIVFFLFMNWFQDAYWGMIIYIYLIKVLKLYKHLFFYSLKGFSTP